MTFRSILQYPCQGLKLLTPRKEHKKQPCHSWQGCYIIMTIRSSKIYYETTTPLNESVLGVLLSLVVTFTVFINAPAAAAL